MCAYTWHNEYFTGLIVTASCDEIQSHGPSHGQNSNAGSWCPSRSDIDRAVKELLHKSIAKSTKDANKRALQRYLSFHTSYCSHANVFPISKKTIVRYIAYCNLKGLKYNTISLWMAGLAYFHKLWGLKRSYRLFFSSSLLKASKTVSFLPDKRLPISM